jgi:hypothetical protein
MEEKEKYIGPLICKHCNNNTLMKVVAKYDQIKLSKECHQGPFWELLLCSSCNEVIL